LAVRRGSYGFACFGDKLRNKKGIHGNGLNSFFFRGGEGGIRTHVEAINP
jgi:hypothetical protein